MQLIGPDASQRRERSAENVVQAAVLARFFDGHDVVRFFDDADCFAIARWPRAVQARIGIGDVVAHRTKSHVHLGVADSIGEGERIIRSNAHDLKREALRTLGPDAAQMYELVDQSLDRFGEIRHEEFSVTECGGPEKSISLGMSASARYKNRIESWRAPSGAHTLVALKIVLEFSVRRCPESHP